MRVFLKKNKIFYAYEYCYLYACPFRSQKQMVDPRELELQVFVSLSVAAKSNHTGALNNRAVS